MTILNEKRKYVVIGFLKFRVVAGIPFLDVYPKYSKSVYDRDPLDVCAAAAPFTTMETLKMLSCPSVNRRWNKVDIISDQVVLNYEDE